MRVNVVHHGACFDGAASSAIFTAMYRACIDGAATFAYLPKAHRPGDPFVETDFAADGSAIVDFRYSTDARLGWFFDHHKSAFQLAGQREHFDADQSGRKFHDDTAPSCTGYIAKIAAEQFGFDPTPHAELLHWAEIIDTASFPNPQMPVELADPALQLMTFIEQNRDPAAAGQFITDLLDLPLSDIATARYVRDVVDPALAAHKQDIELMRQRCQVRDAVGEYDLSDQPPRAYNKFIAYYLFPAIRYLVGVSRGPDGRIKLSAGYNPWLPADQREHDIAGICESLGGGGHPYVGGVSFAASDAEGAARARRDVAELLRHPPAGA